MLHPSDFEVRLGFDHIRRKLTNFCLSGAGASWVAEMQFSTDHTEVSTRLKQTQEFRQIFEKGENFPANHYLDARELLRKTSLEGNYLDESEFFQLANSLQTILEARNFLTKAKELYPFLFALTEQVTLDKRIVNEILAVIDDTAQVKDSASQELSRLRKRLRDEQGKVRKLIDQAYRNAIEQQWVPEGALPTI